MKTITTRVLTLCAGVSNYHPKALRAGEQPLHFAARTAFELHNLFKAIWSDENSQHSLLVDTEVTHPLIGHHSVHTVPYSLAIVYIAGHGRVVDGTFQYVSGSVEGASWSTDAIIEYLVPIQAQHLIVLIDTCHSGLFAHEFARRPIDKKRSVRVVTSCDVNQRSWEDAFLSRTSFGDALIKAWHSSTVEGSICPDELFKAATETVVTHIYALKRGVLQSPTQWLLSKEPILLASKRSFQSQRNLSTIDALILRTRQILSASIVIAITLYTIVFIATWRPAFNDEGRLELRYGPKAQSLTNIGAFSLRVELPFNERAIKDQNTVPSVSSIINEEDAIHPWPGLFNGVSRWSKPIAELYLRDNESLRWRAYLGLIESETELTTRGYLGIGRTASNASVSLALDMVHLFNDHAIAEQVWNLKKDEYADGIGCELPEEEAKILAIDMETQTASPSDRAMRLLVLSRASRMDPSLDSAFLLRTAEEFRAAHLTWETRYENILGNSDISINDRIAFRFEERPTRNEIDALVSFAKSIAQDVDDRLIANNLPKLLEECGNWLAPAIAVLPGEAYPKAVLNWWHSQPARMHEREVLSILAESGRLPQEIVDKVLIWAEFFGNASDTRFALTELGGWLRRIAPVQKFSFQARNQLLDFAEMSFKERRKEDLQLALTILLANVDHLDDADRVRLLNIMENINVEAKFPYEKQALAALWAIAAESDVSLPSSAFVFLEEVAGHLLDNHFVFTPEDRGDLTDTTELHAGFGLDDLIILAKLAVNQHNDKRIVINSTLPMLERGLRDALSFEVAPSSLINVANAVIALSGPLHPTDRAKRAARDIGRTPKDAAKREAIIMTAGLAISRSDPKYKREATVWLKQLWSIERRAHIRYDLARLLIVAETGSLHPLENALPEL
ncbi:hypothetical protein MHM87_05620 [Alteromonas sp. Cnat3-28]|uniref:hypothetical protein n=1 Tax=Alteromonas sp. Cnat3-28 TaxID=2917729 RepID=UPI001EF3FE36|nr:hypothetical protein [Alteromonas sp. Cnat3-28]MCG7645067.1 hypothetical protein [Alteromonas sp. Cnat3-28]